MVNVLSMPYLVPALLVATIRKWYLGLAVPCQPVVARSGAHGSARPTNVLGVLEYRADKSSTPTLIFSSSALSAFSSLR